MDDFNEPRRRHKPHLLQMLDEGLHPLILKMKSIADYLPDTLKAKKSELDEIDFIEAQEEIKKYMKKLPPPRSDLSPNDLVVLHNVRLSLEGSFKLNKMRWNSLQEELGTNLRKRGPQKPRQRRPAPTVGVTPDEQAEADPTLATPDVPNLEQIFEELRASTDPRVVTLQDVPSFTIPTELVRESFDDEFEPESALPAERFGERWDDAIIPEGVNVIPMAADEGPLVHPQPQAEIDPPPVEGATAISIDDVPVVIPEPHLQPVEERVLPRIAVQKPSTGASPTTSGFNWEMYMDAMGGVTTESTPRRQRGQKFLQKKNICRRRVTQLTRKEVNKKMNRQCLDYTHLITKVIMVPKPVPDDSPCLLPSNDVRALGKYMPEWSDDEIEERNEAKFIFKTTDEKLTAFRGITPIRHEAPDQRALMSSVEIQTPLAAPDRSREQISAPSTGGIGPTSPRPPFLQDAPQEIPPVAEPMLREQMVQSRQTRHTHPPTRLQLPAEIETPQCADLTEEPTYEPMAMEPVDVDEGPDLRAVASVEQRGAIDETVPPIGPPPGLTPEEAVEWEKRERRVDQHIRRRGNDESTDVSTVTLSPSFILLESELMTYFGNLWATDSSVVVTFSDLCPPASTTKEKASQTFEILINFAGAGDVLLTQTSPQPQDIFVAAGRNFTGSSSRSAPMSFTLGSPAALPGSSMSLDSSLAVSPKPSETPSD